MRGANHSHGKPVRIRNGSLPSSAYDTAKTAPMNTIVSTMENGRDTAGATRRRHALRWPNGFDWRGFAALAALCAVTVFTADSSSRVELLGYCKRRRMSVAAIRDAHDHAAHQPRVRSGDSRLPIRDDATLERLERV